MSTDERVISRRVFPVAFAVALAFALLVIFKAGSLGALRKSTFRAVDGTPPGHWFLQRQPAISHLLFRSTPDGIPAEEASFVDPSSILVDSEGRLLIADRREHRIYAVAANGRIETYVGNGWPGFTGEGDFRTEARVSFPEGMALDMTGDLVFADAHNHRVRRVSADGTVHTIAGSGVSGYSGDGGPATDASLNRPSDVCITGDGSVVIADVGNDAVRRVRPDGIIETVAGSGTPGFSGDGGPADEATLNKPWGVACTAHGEIFIADSRNHRIRKVNTAGLISTIAGTGDAGFSGDGGPASEASFDSPQEVVLEGGGGMYVVDEHNHAIRYVDAGGIIWTVVGTGEKGEAALGAPATGSKLNDPEDVWVLGPGRILVADGDNGRIRVIDEEGRLWRVAGR